MQEKACRRLKGHQSRQARSLNAGGQSFYMSASVSVFDAFRADGERKAMYA
jgi:hypothetical protein